jgi:hypothetical protein
MNLLRRWLFGFVCRATYLQHRAYVWANGKRSELPPMNPLVKRIVQLLIVLALAAFMVAMYRGDVNQ